MVTTGQKMVWEKNHQGQGKVKECYFESGKFDILKKKPEKFEII